MRQARSNEVESRKGERGVALILVMFVIATLSILVLEFMHSTRINLYIAGNIADGMKSYYLARSGIAVAAGALFDDIQDDKEDHLWEGWAEERPPAPGGEGWVSVEIADENSKFNVNRLVRKSGLPDSIRQEVFRKMLENLELDTELVNAIIDWIDEDEEAINGGMEDAVYGYSTSPIDPYPSKNAKLLSLDELTLINGFTDEIFQKLKPYITIYGDQKLNINTVNEKVLKAYVKVLSDEKDTDPVQDLINWRNEEDNYFKEKGLKNQLINNAGIDSILAGKLVKHFAASSHFFSVTAEAVVGDSKKKCLGVIQRSKKNVRILYFRFI